jgi:hypothetical protein
MWIKLQNDKAYFANDKFYGHCTFNLLHIPEEGFAVKVSDINATIEISGVEHDYKLNKMQLNNLIESIESKANDELLWEKLIEDERAYNEWIIDEFIRHHNDN